VGSQPLPWYTSIRSILLAIQHSQNRLTQDKIKYK
jgi:hypothetical protein